MATIPIYNPQSPFLGLIPGGLQARSTLRIRATIQGFSNRCQISLQGGAALQPRDDVMLHLSIRPQENCIIRNHFKNQAWGAEERFGGNPIQAHQSFEISITAEPTQYRISVNGQHFCTFSHRLPLNLVQFVSISGTCTITHILVDQSGPSIGFPPIQVNPSNPIHPRHPPVHHPPVHHHPPAPPPMPHYPPPYPGHYPGHQHPTPYTTTEKDDKKSIKVAAAVGAGVGLTAIALSRAARKIGKKN